MVVMMVMVMMMVAAGLKQSSSTDNQADTHGTLQQERTSYSQVIVTNKVSPRSHNLINNSYF